MSTTASRHGAPRTDDGLFGPGSVTWRIMGEPVIWVAGFRALYLQALHPRVMRGTWQNTSFARPGEAWGRFVRTTEFVGVRTYGTLAQVDRAARRVRKIHASLTGTDAEGNRFRLDEPELLLWVHCGEIASYADIARRSAMGVSARGSGRVRRRAAPRRGGVGLDPAAVPASMAELDAYYEEIRPRPSTPARRRSRRCGSPTTRTCPCELLALKLMVPPLNTLAFASLPRWARKMYGAPGSPLTDVGATVALRMAHAVHDPQSRAQLLYLPAARAARASARGRRAAAKDAGQVIGAYLGGTFQDMITGWPCSVPSVENVPVSSRNRRPPSGSSPSQRAVSTRSTCPWATSATSPSASSGLTRASTASVRGSHLRHGLAGMRGVAGDHAVPPEVPARALGLDLRRRPPLVAAVIPFPQVRVELGVLKPGELCGAHRPLRPGW